MDDFCLRLVNVGAVQRLAKNNDLRFNLNLILDNRFKQYSGDISEILTGFYCFIISYTIGNDEDYSSSKILKISSSGLVFVCCSTL